MFPSYHELDPRAPMKDAEDCLLCEKCDVCIEWWPRFNWLLHAYDFNISKIPVKLKRYNTKIKEPTAMDLNTSKVSFTFSGKRND